MRRTTLKNSNDSSQAVHIAAKHQPDAPANTNRDAANGLVHPIRALHSLGEVCGGSPVLGLAVGQPRPALLQRLTAYRRLLSSPLQPHLARRKLLPQVRYRRRLRRLYHLELLHHHLGCLAAQPLPLQPSPLCSKVLPRLHRRPHRLRHLLLCRPQLPLPTMQLLLQSPDRVCVLRRLSRKPRFVLFQPPRPLVGRLDPQLVSVQLRRQILVPTLQFLDVSFFLRDLRVCRGHCVLHSLLVGSAGALLRCKRIVELAAELVCSVAEAAYC